MAHVAECLPMLGKVASSIPGTGHIFKLWVTRVRVCMGGNQMMFLSPSPTFPLKSIKKNLTDVAKHAKKQTMGNPLTMSTLEMRE